eukprot:2976827-Ditylum_brightwellii.AAC.1
MAEESITHFTGCLCLCCHDVAIATAATIATAASTTACTVIFAAITTNMAAYTNPTKPRPTSATISAAACTASPLPSPLPHAFVAFTYS